MDKLLQYYYDYFINAENGEGYKLLASSVCITLMSSKYESWLRNNEVEPMDNLPKEKKLKLWELTIRYEDNEEKKILACKAAYALQLMTGKTD